MTINNKVIFTIVAAGIWVIWKVRNDWVFKNRGELQIGRLNVLVDRCCNIKLYIVKQTNQPLKQIAIL
jgi:hypothetical protein